MQKIIHTVTIKASQEKVFEALTTQNGLSRWWSTKVTAEEKQGGKVDFSFVDGFNPTMKITKLKKPMLLRWECVSGHEPWKGNLFAFALTKKEGATQLMFSQDYTGKVSDEEFGNYNFNWAYYLQSLRDYCETGTGKPHQA